MTPDDRCKFRHFSTQPTTEKQIGVEFSAQKENIFYYIDVKGLERLTDKNFSC